jgi:hypothetical protein
MDTAFVLMNVERHNMHSVVERLICMNCISEVYRIDGRFDLIAVLKYRVPESFNESLQGVKGITHSEVLLGFNIYSKDKFDWLTGIELD